MERSQMRPGALRGSGAQLGRTVVAPWGVVGIFAAASLWALVGIVTKRLYAVSTITPLAVGALRLLLATPALCLASQLLERRPWRIKRADWPAFLLYGIVMAGYQLGFLGALTSTTVTAATLLLTTAPVFVTLLTGIIWREWPTPVRALLLLLAVTGAGLVVLGAGAPASGVGISVSPQALRGDALALGAALAYACYYLLSGTLGQRYGGIQVMSVAIGMGALLLVPFALAWGGLGRAALSLSPLAWGFVLVLALGSTALSYAVYGVAMRRVPGTLASVAALIEPAIAAGLAWWFLGERLAPVGIVGALLLLSGIAGTYFVRSRQAGGKAA